MSNSESVNFTKNMIDFKFRNWNLIFSFTSGIKNCLLIQFSPIELFFIKKSVTHKLILKFKALQGHLFFFEIRKLSSNFFFAFMTLFPTVG